MKVQLLVPLAICVSVALLGIIRIRKTEQDREEKRNRFQTTKLRVTIDVLEEYQTEKVETQKQLDKISIDLKAMDEEVNKLKAKADTAKSEVDTCEGSKKSAKDESAKIETELNNLNVETEKEKASWKTEVETLKKKLAERSSVCDFLKKDSQAASKLCGNEVKVNVNAPKKEEPKVEVPKKEEPKVEAPKKEEPKVEAPKKEEPKVEAPKKEEPKKEEPKKEAPKKR